MTDRQSLLGLVLLLLVVGLIYSLQAILAPFLVGALLAYLGDPIADRLEARGIGRSWAVSLVFLLLTLVLTVVLLLSIPLIGRQLDILGSKLPEWYEAIVHQLIPWLQHKLDLPADSMNLSGFRATLGEHWMTAGSILQNLWWHIAGSSMKLAAWAANIVLIPVVTFYLLRDWDLLIARLRDLLPRSIEPTVVGLATDCDEILSSFIRGQLLVMLALGVIYSIGLSIVGLELALLLGLIAGLASIVPYLGFIVGIVAACLSAYFQYHEWLPLLWVGLVFAVGQTLESVILTPLLVGDRIGLHPVAVIFAIMAGGQLAGFVGVLLALPVAAVIMVLLRFAYGNYRSSELYSETAVDDDGGGDALTEEAGA